jgi:hypothetical protein
MKENIDAKFLSNKKSWRQRCNFIYYARGSPQKEFTLRMKEISYIHSAFYPGG